MRIRNAAIGFALLALASLAGAHDMSTMSPVAAATPPLYHLGEWTHAVTTSSPQAQRYFDQGLRLSYAFNHEEASKAFREAVRLDSTCAMAWWGIALVAGPHINWPMMDSAHVATAMAALAAARRQGSHASAAERDYIEALGCRYVADPNAPRAPLDSAYANAMRGLAHAHPDDADAQVLFAESMLDLSPWNQWSADGTALPGTDEIIATLEKALARWPNHPGANHFYVHAMEASEHPEKALPAARRLETLVPDAGHLVHMPSHIYARTSQFEDARRVNEHAVDVDDHYIADRHPEGLYPMMYASHNVHFVWFASCMEGRSAEALSAAQELKKRVPDEMARQMNMLEFWPAVQSFTYVRFGRWPEALKAPEPAADLRFERYAWHYARGMAAAHTGQAAMARAELDSVTLIAQQLPEDFTISINPARPVARIGIHVLAGTIAACEKKHADAITELRAAVACQDSLHYDEPPTWYEPPRQALGPELLTAGQAREAEQVFRDDLKRHPGNGWSLLGLQRALAAQGRASEAAAAERDFKRAWAHADITAEVAAKL
jgi:tetratricopeptide (TPR) repeat protein